MIKYLLLFASLIPVSSIAQQNVEGKTGHSEIVEVKNATAKILSERAVSFLQLKKVETKIVGNIISGTGSFNVSYPSVKKGTDIGHVKFAIKIMVKEGKYKVDLTDFRHEGIHGKSSGGSLDLEKAECGEAQILNVAWDKIKGQTNEQLKTFVSEMKSKMDNPAKVAKPSSDF